MDGIIIEVIAKIFNQAPPHLPCRATLLGYEMLHVDRIAKIQAATRLKGSLLIRNTRFHSKRTLKTVPLSSHDSLESFQAYARSTSLSTSSTYYVGTLYEYTVAAVLARYNLVLHRCGGGDDKGIDLRGSWALPSGDKLPVIAQCKAESRKLGPRHVREIEGASLMESRDTLAILVTLLDYTKAAQRQVMSSSRPLALCVINQNARLSHMVWNAPATELIGPGLSVQTRHFASDIDVPQELVLTYEGRLLSHKTVQ